MRKRTAVLAGVALSVPALVAVAPSAANATPYAVASNQITGLTVTFANGTSIPSADISSAIVNASDFALYNTNAAASDQGAAPVGTALSLTPAYSGPGPNPGGSFTPVGAGGFTGTRSNAAISAGSAASGGVSVSNIAEGNGNAVGNSTGNNSSTITFAVTGTGQALKLSFTDAIDLMAATAANPQETATASITNSFSVTPQGSTAPLATYQPSALNVQISSQAGVPPTNSLADSAAYTFTTPALTSGVTYNISLSSGSSENIFPGTAVPTPEPATLSVLGTALLGLGLVLSRKRT